MNQKHIKIMIGLMIILAISLFFVFDLSQYASLSFLQEKQEMILHFKEQNFFLVFVIFTFSYVLVATLSLPIATALTLLGGALFGFYLGLIFVSFASSIGATFAFLIARFLARDFVQKKYKSLLVKINSGFEKEGEFYLFALRLVPVFPFFVINVLMALMPIKTRTFYWVSQIGMLPATAVYVYAGGQLTKIESLADIVSINLIFVLVLLGIFPLITKKFLQLLRKNKNNESL